MTVAASKMLRTLALATVFAVGFLPAIARAESPFALRLGLYGCSDSQSRELLDNRGYVVGFQYGIGGVPSILNGESWSTNISVEYMGRFTTKTEIEVHAIPVSINQIYTFEEQNGHTPFAGFSVSAITLKSDLVTPAQPWVTRIGVGLLLGLNLNDKMFIEGRYDRYIQAGPDGFRAIVGYRF